MRLFRHYEHLPTGVRGGAVAIGNFDGVHLGHHAVIGEAGRIACSAGVPWSVLTLEPHPRCVFQSDAEPFRLTPFHAKARLIEALGVEVLIVVPFDRDFARHSAWEFVRRVLVDGIAARFVVSGHNFGFGHAR
jgi:riboflavin kinase/FMN adenylyltransferase